MDGMINIKLKNDYFAVVFFKIENHHIGCGELKDRQKRHTRCGVRMLPRVGRSGEVVEGVEA